MKLFLLTLMVSLTGIWLFNYARDISGLRQVQLAFDLSQKQKPGELLLATSELNQRAWVKGRLKHSGGCPAILFLGSSTIGNIDEKTVGTKSFLNAWLSQPTVEDFESITNILHETNCIPEKVLIGTDHWLFNNAYQSYRWTSIRDDFRSVVRRRAGKWAVFSPKYMVSFFQLYRVQWSEFTERLSYVTTRASLKSLRVTNTERPPLSLSDKPSDDVCKTMTENDSLRTYYGNFVYCENWMQSLAKIDEIADGYVVNNTHQVNLWRKIDETRFDRFAQVVRDLSSTGSQVVLLSPPYHPNTYKKLQENARIWELFTELDKGLDRLNSKRVSYFNFRDARLVPCSSAGFSDSHHSLRACFEPYVQNVLRVLK